MKQVNVTDQQLFLLKMNFFLVLIRLRLGLMEQDLADRFEISQSTVSRIIITWINFLFLKLKEIPIIFIHPYVIKVFTNNVCF